MNTRCNDSPHSASDDEIPQSLWTRTCRCPKNPEPKRRFIHPHIHHINSPGPCGPGLGLQMGADSPAGFSPTCTAAIHIHEPGRSLSLSIPGFDTYQCLRLHRNTTISPVSGDYYGLSTKKTTEAARRLCGDGNSDDWCQLR